MNKKTSHTKAKKLQKVNKELPGDISEVLTFVASITAGAIEPAP